MRQRLRRSETSGISERAVRRVKEGTLQLGCVLQDTERPESSLILRKGTEVLGSTRRARFTTAPQRHANIRDNQGPSLGTIQVKSSHQRRPYAMKFEDTIRPKINSNDFGSFWNQLADSNSIFLSLRKLYFLNDSNFWCVQSSVTHNVAVHVHVLWLVCAHTQFHFECCGVGDDIYIYIQIFIDRIVNVYEYVFVYVHACVFFNVQVCEFFLLS